MKKCGHNWWVIYKGKLVCLCCDAPNPVTDSEGKTYGKAEVIKQLEKGRLEDELVLENDHR